MTVETLNLESQNNPTPAIAAEPSPVSATTEKHRRSTEPPGDPSRCHYRYPNGRRCTLPGLSAKSGLCLRHYNRQVAAGLPLSPLPDDSADLSGDLLGGLSRFSSAEDLRKFLTRLLILMTKGRVSPRRAAVLAYITNQLMHSQRAVLKEEELDNTSRQILFDVPRPESD